MTATFVCAAAETVLTFGTFKGATLQHVLETKPTYLDWLARDAKEETLRVAARETKVAGKDLLKGKREAKTAAQEAERQAAIEANFQETEIKESDFLDAALPLLVEGSLVYGSCGLASNETGRLYGTDGWLRITRVEVPVSDGGRSELAVTGGISQFYSLCVFGYRVRYDRQAGAWVFGTEEEKTYISRSRTSHWGTSFRHMQDLPRYLEVMTHRISPSSDYDGHFSQSGDLLDTTTNQVAGTYSHSSNQHGTGYFFGTDYTEYSDSYALLDGRQGKAEYSDKKGDTRSGSAWDRAWGPKPATDF